jgi:hypothetical protein
MSTFLRRHPEDEQLLRYADGELPTRLSADVRSHLEVCWQCRTELQELETVIGKCVKYRKEILPSHLPPPPAAWGVLDRRFDEIDAAARPLVPDRILRFLQYPVRHARQWAPAVVALALIAAIVYRYEFSPSVQAAELLRKASFAENSAPRKTRRLQIRTRTSRFVRPPRVERQMAADRNAQASVAALFQAAHYSWDDPLSARSFRAWRDQLAEKKDAVAILQVAPSAERNGYRIDTSTRSSELMHAALTLRAPDLLAVEARFDFRDGEWVEITELAEKAASPPETAGVKNDRPAAATHTLAFVPPPRTARPSTASNELHVLDALHGMGADLGEPIEVKRTGAEVLVTAAGLPAARQQQLRNALGARPDVVLRFPDATVPPLQTTPAESSGTASNTGDGELRARMESQLGGQRFVAQLTRQILAMSESMMSRAYALRRLAEQMPAGVEAELTAGDRQLLLKLYRDHETALTSQEADIERVLDPLLTSLGVPNTGAASNLAAAGNWQSSTEELFQAARSLDRQLAQLLDLTPAEAHTEQLPAQVRSSLAELRARAQVCENAAAQELQ